VSIPKIGLPWALHSDLYSMFSADLDRFVENLGLRVFTCIKDTFSESQSELDMRTPNWIHSAAMSRLDYMIPLNESHLMRILKAWAAYYNQSRPHMTLGPGIPEPPGAPHSLH